MKPKTEIKIGQVWREKRPFAHMAWHREVRVTEMAYVPHNSSDMGDRRWRKRE